MLKGEQKAGLNAGGTAEHNKSIVSRPGICNRIPWRDFYLKFSRNTEKSRSGKEKAAWNLTGVKRRKQTGIREILSGDYVGKTVKMNGAVHNIRDMGEFAFIILRKAEGLVQCVYEEGKTEFDLKDLKEELAVEVTGVIALERACAAGLELRLTGIRCCELAETMPIAINKWKMNTSLETRLSLRPVSVRNVRERAKFKIQEGIVRGFREFLSSQGFTEVHTPKIVSRGAEGGANVFKLNYFNKKAVGQS